MVRSLWSCTYVDWVALEAEHSAGGVLIVWEKGFGKDGGHGWYFLNIG